MFWCCIHPQKFEVVSCKVDASEATVAQELELYKHVSERFSVVFVFCGYCEFVLAVYFGLSNIAAVEAYLLSSLHLLVCLGLIEYDPYRAVPLVSFFATVGTSVSYSNFARLRRTEIWWSC